MAGASSGELETKAEDDAEEKDDGRCTGISCCDTVELEEGLFIISATAEAAAVAWWLELIGSDVSCAEDLRR